MKSKLNNRLKGYHKTFRGRFLLLRILTNSEYLLWDISFSVLADWDKEHTDTYGTFDNTQEEIGKLLGCDKSNISRLAVNLYRHGLWRRRTDGRIEVCGFDIVEGLANLTKDDGIVNLQLYIDRKQLHNSEQQQIHVNPQQVLSKDFYSTRTQNDEKLQSSHPKDSLVSSKDISKFYFTTEKLYWQAKKRIRDLEKEIAGRWITQDVILQAKIEEYDRLDTQVLLHESKSIMEKIKNRI